MLGLRQHKTLSGAVLYRFIGATLACIVCFTAGCQRTPQTAAELAKALPQAYAGELHLQGETETRHIRVQARELSIRSEHVLEFNRVDYQVQDAPDAPGC